MFEDEQSTRAIPTVSAAVVKADVPCMTIVYHPDFNRIGERSRLGALMTNGVAQLSRNEPLFVSPSQDGCLGRAIADPYISRSAVNFKWQQDQLTVTLPKSGYPLAVNGLQVEVVSCWNKAQLEAGLVITLSSRIVLLLHTLPADYPEIASDYGLLGHSYNIAQVRAQISKVADLNVPVLIRGASGTGKELVANAIHHASQRGHRDLVSVNVAAIPASLAPSELFGAAKGAFTGSVKEQRGYFQQADGSSLFLDEIGDAAEELQVALLRALESGEVQPVGSQRTSSVDVRFISATDANLEQMVSERSFRTPLLQRLAGFEIHLQPLCERRDDIGRLLIAFLEQQLSITGELQRLDSEAQDVVVWAQVFEKCCAYDWPGNIRQMKNIVRQLVIDCRGEGPESWLRRIDQLLPKVAQTRQEITSASALPASTGVVMEVAGKRRKPSDVEAEELEGAMLEARWDVKRAADLLNISRASLYLLIDAHPNLCRAGDVPIELIEQAHEQHAGDLEAMVDQLRVSKAALKRRMKEMRLVIKSNVAL